MVHVRSKIVVILHRVREELANFTDPLVHVVLEGLAYLSNVGMLLAPAEVAAFEVRWIPFDWDIAQEEIVIWKGKRILTSLTMFPTDKM
eukprot:gene16765-22227_t